MNVIFLITMLIATVAVAVINPENFVGIMLSGATDAVTLSVKLVAVYAVWMSVLEMMDRAGLNAKMTKLCRPLTNALFKGESDETKKYITVNLASNMLGLGGAATPAGIKAISLMDNGSGVATKNMIMLVVVNATSIQLIPATVMSLLASNGATNPSSIILPTLISTAVSTVTGIILVKALYKK